ALWLSKDAPGTKQARIALWTQQSGGNNARLRHKRQSGQKVRRHSHQHHLIRESTQLLLDQPLPTQANTVAVCDVTYIRINNAWSYLCVIMDLCTRRIVGWHFSADRNADLVREVILMALLDQTPAADAIFHTDQGIEFANKNIRELVLTSGFR